MSLPVKNGEMPLVEVVDQLLAPIGEDSDPRLVDAELACFDGELYKKAEERLVHIIGRVGVTYFPACSIVLERFAEEYAAQKASSPSRAQNLEDIYGLGSKIGLTKTALSTPDHMWEEARSDFVLSFATNLAYDEMPDEEVRYDPIEQHILNDLADRLTAQIDDPRHHNEAVHIGYRNAIALGHMATEMLVNAQ